MCNLKFAMVFFRELRFILRNRAYVFLFLLWPLLDGLLIAGIYSEKTVTRMPVAVMDGDRSKLSRALIRSIDSSRSFSVIYLVNSPESLKDLMYRQKIAAGIHIPRSLEKDMKRGKTGIVTAFVNGSNFLMTNLALADLRTMTASVGAGMRMNYLQKTGSPRDKALAQAMPVKTDLTKLYNPGYNYVNYLAPGLWAAILQQVMMLFGALMIAGEKDRNTFPRLMACAGNSAFAAAAGKIALYFALSLLLFEITVRAMFPLFGIPFKGSVPAMILYSSLFILASVCMGFLFSSALKTRVDALKATLLVSAPAFILSGYTWPVSSMPAVLWPVAGIIPLTTYLKGYRRLYMQGAGLSAVTNEMMVLAAMSVIFFAAGLLFMRKTARESHVP